MCIRDGLDKHTPLGYIIDMDDNDTKKISNRFVRASGQVQGVGKMLNEGRYCVDVIRQIRAAKSALAALESVILERHLHTCVREAFAASDSLQSEAKIDELLKLFREAAK